MNLCFFSLRRSFLTQDQKKKTFYPKTPQQLFSPTISVTSKIQICTAIITIAGGWAAASPSPLASHDAVLHPFDLSPCQPLPTAALQTGPPYHGLWLQLDRSSPTMQTGCAVYIADGLRYRLPNQFCEEFPLLSRSHVLLHLVCLLRFTAATCHRFCVAFVNDLWRDVRRCTVHDMRQGSIAASVHDCYTKATTFSIGGVYNRFFGPNDIRPSCILQNKNKIGFFFCNHAHLPNNVATTQHSHAPIQCTSRYNTYTQQQCFAWHSSC